jgi:hypothetical protein
MCTACNVRTYMAETINPKSAHPVRMFRDLDRATVRMIFMSCLLSLRARNLRDWDSFKSQTDIAKEFNVSQVVVSNIQTGRTFSHWTRDLRGGITLPVCPA